VSMNIEDWRASPLHEVVARVEAEAAARGVAVAGGELVGLLPAGAVLGAAAPALRLAELGAARVLELRLLESEEAAGA
jgi:glutamate formiminotransferase